MRRVRFDHLLASAAVAMALALSSSASGTFAQSTGNTAGLVPMPESANLPPPTVKDISPVAAPAAAPIKVSTGSTTSVSTDVTSSVPAPASAKETAASIGDTTIVDKLRELSAGKFDRFIGGRGQRAGIEAFYSSRDFAPLWITDSAMNERAKAAAAYLSGVAADGLDASDYPVPEIKAGLEPDALAEAELKFTATILTFIRHAENGRVHYSRVASDILYELVKIEPAEVLGKIASAKNVGEALDSFNPPQPGYKALKAKLAEARDSKGEVGKTPIAQGEVLKYSKDRKGKEVLMSDPRVPLLRERLGVAGNATDTHYDKALADAVAKFQTRHDLKASGQLTSATVDAINGPKRDRDVDIIIANMERWRWMPRDLGRTYVMVNIPDYSLRVLRDGKLVWNTKVVVGKPNLATPITSAEMKFITVNPTWNVPPSIIQNEYLPALQQDPQAMERIGLKVEQNRDGTIRIYQPPGERNALGRIRFNFPNKFLVYQHDTPDKHLFAHDKRAYSHGCMRVEDPIKYGEVLLSLVLPNENYTQERLRKMIGGGEININFPTNIPVHLTYQTAFVDDAGKLVIRDDVYGRDARVLAALKGSERRMADIPIDRKSTSTPPVRMPAGTFASSFGGYSGPSFFDRLFGVAEPATPPRPRARVGRANSRESVR